MATATRKSILACTSTTNSASASSRASISTITAPSNPSKFLSFTSPTPAAAPQTFSPADGAQRTIYNWDLNPSNLRESQPGPSGTDGDPDLAITTFSSWTQLRARLLGRVNTFFGTWLWLESLGRIGAAREPVPTSQLYDFVSRKIATVDLPLDIDLPFRGAEEIFSSDS